MPASGKRSFSGTLTIGEQQFTTKDTNDDFCVVKRDDKGVVQWAKAPGITGSELYDVSARDR